MIETNRIEFKRELTRELDIEREVVAFLNYREGGTIYIGIDDNGHPVKINDIDDDMLKVKARIRNNILPSPMGLFDVQTETIEGTQVIKIVVASGSEKPYYKAQYGMSPRGCFIRVGTAVEPMPQDMIDRLYATRTRHSLSRIVANRQDLTFEQLRIYYTEHGKKLNDNFARTLELLTEDGKYNYIAYLLADENGNSIKVAKYSSLDRCDLIENNEYGYCSLIKATKSVLSKLEIENKTAASITPVERIETPMWDRVALREAVINAIVHNDYSFEVPPKFEIFPDRLEITSAGRLPETMTLQEFFDGVSMPRNKELMRIYKDVELVESLGSGIPRILRVYGEGCFHFTDNFIRITLPISQPQTATNGGQVGGKNGVVSGVVKLTDRQHIIMGLIRQFVVEHVVDGVVEDGVDKLSARVIAQKVKSSTRTIQRELAYLQEKGLIKYNGTDTKGYYEIVK